MSIVEEGQLKGSFKGFRNRDTVFEFYGGRGKWRQNEYKYHYAYMPRAKVLETGRGYEIEVEGMNDRVQVVRLR